MVPPSANRRSNQSAWSRQFLFPALRSASLALFALLAALPGVPLRGAVVTDRVLTSATFIRKMSVADARRELPVQITGVVTYLDKDWRLLFVQDATAGIFVFYDEKHVPPDLRVGVQVHVAGVTVPGDFCASIKSSQIVVLGPASLPVPLQPSDDALFAGVYDSQWAQLSGVVRSTRVEAGRLYIDLVRNGQHLNLTLKTYPQAWLSSLADAEVVGRGVLSTRFNVHRQVIGVKLEVPDPSFIQIVKAPPPDPYLLPESSVGSLGQFSPSGSLHREHVRGTVEAIDPGAAIYISDGVNSVSVQAGTCSAHPGDVIEVVGFPAAQDFKRTLENAVCRVLGKGPLKRGRTIAADDILQNRVDQLASDTQNDMSIVQVEATLLHASFNAETYTLLLQSGETIFNAVLPLADPLAAPHLEDGSKLSVRAFCVIHYDSFQKAESFRLLLRSPGDIQVVSRPPWWSQGRALWALAIASAVGGLGLFWVFTLRRRVAHQTTVISDKLQREVNLENRYRRLFEANIAAVLSFSPDGTLLDCNPRFATLIGRSSASDLTGIKLTPDVFSPEEFTSFVNTLKNESSVNRELSVRDVNGNQILALASGVWTEGDDQNSLVQTTLVDITAQRLFERQLIQAKDAAEAASEMKTQFLANMSHEIRTPLNGVLGMTSLALSADLPEEVRSYLDVAKDSATHLLVLLNDILDFSKIEAGKLELEHVEFQPREIIRNAVRTLAVPAQQKNLELLCSVDDDVPDAVFGDPHRIQQILLNLVGNAIKFTSTGEVSVFAGAEFLEDNRVGLRISVQDSGVGISLPSQKHIFDAFTQADGSTTRKYGGTGLGLSICKALVANMGGEIAVSSEQGKGSLFTFTCVLEIAKERDRAARDGHAVLVGREAVVLMENPVAMKALRQALERWGLVCSTAENLQAVSALFETAVAARRDFPIALLDVKTSSSIFDFLTDIRSRFGTLATVIPMLDSVDLRNSADRCQAAGASLHLFKPLDINELHAAVVQAAMSTAQTREQKTNPPEISPVPAPSASAGSGLRILLAEDNLVNQKVARALLKRLGHSVDVVDNGAQAVEAAGRATYDVVLMDVQMPVMDGFEATAQIRNLGPGFDSLPIVAVTAHAMEGYRDRCLAAGMTDYLTKPINTLQLAAVLSNIGPQTRPTLEALSQ